MTTLKLRNLLLRSSDSNPYAGKLSKEENVFAAIELGELFKKFAEEGHTDEAMDIEVSQWVEVIENLKSHPAIKAPLSN